MPIHILIVGAVVWYSGMSERFHRGDPGSIPTSSAWLSKSCTVVVDGFANSGVSNSCAAVVDFVVVGRD